MKKRNIIVGIIAIGAIIITIEWNNFIIKDFNMYIKNKLKVVELESNSNSDYMGLGPNMVVNYSGQVENKGQIYSDLVNQSNKLLIKSGIYLNNPLIKVDFQSIKIMSGIKYYPVEVYSINNDTDRVLKYSFYISLEGNLMPPSKNVSIDKNINMISNFEDNEEVNESYLLSSEEINSYRNNKDFNNQQKKLYYRLCEMAKLNIFGTTYITGYNFVVNISNTIEYNNEPYYEIYIYNQSEKDYSNGGLVYKFYMSASGNIVNYQTVIENIAQNSTNNSEVNSKNITNSNNNTTNNNTINSNNSTDNINNIANNNINNLEKNNKENSSGENLNSNLNGNIKDEKKVFNNLYKLSMEYEGLLAENNENYSFEIDGSKKIDLINYYAVKITGNNNFLDEFYISNNGNIYREKNK